MLYYAYIGLGAFLFSLLGTRLTVLAMRKRVQPTISIPGLHEAPKKHGLAGGGVAVVFSLVVFLLAVDAAYVLIFALLFLAAFSFLCDWIDINPLIQLLVQFLAIILVLEHTQFVLFPEWLPLWADRILVIVGWAWFIQLFHVMDGADGMSAAEASCICAGMCLVTAFSGAFGSQLSLYALVLFAAAVGFYWWNKFPAKIFLGEVGAVPIGFLLGYILLLAAKESHGYAALILPAYYLTDGFFTLVRRVIHGGGKRLANTGYFYQRSLANGTKPNMLVHLIFGVNMLLIFLATFATLYPEIAPFTALVAYAACGGFIAFIARGHHADVPSPSA